MKTKLGIVIPYRNRYQQLLTFKEHIVNYLNQRGFNYELIVIEQDNAKAFNRGKLLNIGFFKAKILGCTHIVFHDVDMLPIDVDYTPASYPIHLASNFECDYPDFDRLVYDEYIGGVVMFPIEQFEKINGYSNDYWGWGYEDDDLLFRCKSELLKLREKTIINKTHSTAALKFYGENSYVKFKNTLDITKDFSIFISLHPDDIECDIDKYDDIFPIFSIPGYDFKLTYSSYKRYSLEIFNEDNQVTYIMSGITINHKTNFCITVSQKHRKITLYQDGEFIGSEYFEKLLFNYNKTKVGYLGCSNINANKKDQKFFKGTIDVFAVFNDCLLKRVEVRDLAENKHLGLTQTFKNYKSPDKLSLYYDAKFIRNYELIDLSELGNNGTINNCEIVEQVLEQKKFILVPYRREGKFKLLPHEENGYVGMSWKDQVTRYNQVKFFNEVLTGIRDYKKDGLSNCNYKVLGEIRKNNQTQMIVSI